MSIRKVLCFVEVDDNKAIEEDIGTIDYLERTMLTLNGVCLKEARILDDDDECDANAIAAADKIFNEEI